MSKDLQIIKELEETLNIEIPEIEKKVFHHYSVAYNLNDQKEVIYLSLSECGVQNKDLELIGGLTSLKWLKLSNNQITKIKGLDGLTSLEVLYLNDNKISKIEGLNGSTSLKWLCLSGNEIPEKEINKFE